MSIFSDAWDAISGAASDVADVAGDVFNALPGGVQVSGALKDLVNGPLRDFARSPVGMVTLRAIATTMYGPLAWQIGPTLATVAWTTPGLLRGESFDEAWLAEFKWRVEKTAEVLGPGILDAFGGQVKTAVADLAQRYGVGQYVDVLAEELARRLSIRADVAQFVIDLWNRTGPPGREAFDLLSGLRITAAQRATRNTVDQIRTTVEGRAATAAAVARARGGVQNLTTTFQSAAYRPALTLTTRATSSPAIASSGGTTSSPTKKSGDVLLAVTILGAAAALAWWHSAESR